MFNQHSYAYIEDDPLSRQIMQTIFERIMQVEHYLILENSEDFRARLLAAAKTPDIVMLDIHIRPYSGVEMLKMLREDPQFENAVIIALTASVMSDEIEQLKAAGFDGTVGKPLNVRTFPELIERIMRGERVWHIS